MRFLLNGNDNPSSMKHKPKISESYKFTILNISLIGGGTTLTNEDKTNQLELPNNSE